MKRLVLILGSLTALAACEEMPGAEGLGLPAGSENAYREYLVLGSTMSFESCRSRGGLIIRDQGSPMVACDPDVRGEPVPAGEFDHPDAPVGANAGGVQEAQGPASETPAG